MLQEFEQLFAERVQVDSILEIDGMIGIGAHYVKFCECVG